ncbi:MAG: hypothetical protein ACYDAD_12035 [Acidimicrobiales bacterium]
MRAHRLAPFVAATAVVVLAGCGGSSTPTPSAAAPAAQTPAGSSPQVLPVTANPISNPSTAPGLKVDSVLVENNVDAANRPVSDHIEVALHNTGTSQLSGFEVFYTVTDPTAKLSESYYTKLPPTFTIAAGAKQTIHFDNTGAPDHFPVNKFGLFLTSKNALDIKVMVSATGAAPQTASVHKSAGGAENTSQ